MHVFWLLLARTHTSFLHFDLRLETSDTHVKRAVKLPYYRFVDRQDHEKPHAGIYLVDAKLANALRYCLNLVGPLLYSSKATSKRGGRKKRSLTSLLNVAILTISVRRTQFVTEFFMVGEVIRKFVELRNNVHYAFSNGTMCVF